MLFLFQEAIKNDSIDVQMCDSKGNLDKHIKSTRASVTLPVPRISTPSSPLASPFIPPYCHMPRVCTLQHPHHQRIFPPGSPSRASRSPSDSMLDLADPADEEVHHINSSARLWAGVPADGRCHSLSPYVTPWPLPVKNCSSATNLTDYSTNLKFFSVDARGFLDKPSVSEDHRRHSIEICSSVDNGAFEQGVGEKRLLPTRGQSLHIPRKKKMSPPCIAVEPPLETVLPPSLLSMKKLSESTLLRRRTPSYELALQRDSLDFLEHQLPSQPLLKVERQPSHCGEYLSLPRFPFHQSVSSSCILRESNLSAQPPHYDSALEESTDFSTVNRTAQ